MNGIKQKLKTWKSMRLCLFLLVILISGIVLSVVSFSIHGLYKTQAIKSRISELTQYGTALATQMTVSGYLAGSGMNEINSELDVAADIFEGRIIVVDSSLRVISDTYNYEVGKILITKEVISCLRGTNSMRVEEKRSYMELTLPITQGETREHGGVLIIRASLEQPLEIAKEVEHWIFVIDIILMCLVVVAAFFTSGWMVKPFKAIIASIRHVTEGYLEDMVSIRGFSEVERISDSFNEMLKQMKKVEESRQEFVSNVSHELKTPMTSIKVLADSLMSQEEVPVELYREFMVDINDEIERETKIINDLLSLDRKSVV